ncbi:DEAD/DEAH box helicase [Natranaeroarchaeum sulfidigenes]|uniref:Putative DNA 3'-5' helicase Rad25 n=1 Tax=Natranaeroarchaeum sulfidigenes TaxID=2784880 RepID=A0A897MNF0_9EURY|nr:DEAD/DEAH box helicase [Natranaeroarchaeum sulfidigenes]QSG02077.1 ssDNA-dependent ATPase, helicase superfamily II [Natranaeroarchaeum sulfidigenes]
MTEDEPSPPDESPADSDDTNTPRTLSISSFYDALEAVGRPVITASELAREADWSHAEADGALDNLVGSGELQRIDVETDPVVWFPTDWGELADRERVIPFPRRREIVVDKPTQFTRAQLSQFAHLVDVSGAEAYRYEIRKEDIWQAPYESFDRLLRTIRQVLPERQPELEEWIKDQWNRARQFRLRTHEDGYTVLEAVSAELMGNVARQELDESQLRAPISDTESWVAEGSEASIKRRLYEAGYPVQDNRELETGDPLDISLDLDLRGYQRDWVSRFVDSGSGVLVGPPGSGKTVAAMGIMEAVGGETLILVPTRELASQWRDELLARTDLTAEQIGQYHGGAKEIRPITIATYRTAGMDRHRSLFDSRRWGLIVYDEVHHVPSDVYRRTGELQSRHRLGLSATPIREDEREQDIYTLVGPPIGTDWDELFDAGYVQEPKVEIRYVPWDEETYQDEYATAESHEKRQLAAANPLKTDEIRSILGEHGNAKALIFADYIDQGDALAEALSIPFISGEMRHARREKLFSQFRQGERDTLIVSRVGDEGIDLPDADLAILSSGLGGSRRQGSQRAGRTMRPAGKSRVYVLATRGTTEEDFAQRQLQHLRSKGIRVQEVDSERVNLE